MTEAPATTHDDGPLLSVVVPLHEVEAYLEECLDSLLAQDVDDLEVWCIDDGSTDGSAAIAERYAAADERFRVVRQDNAGLGATRNRGAALATGRYLAFLDSDDLLPAGAYARMLAAIEESGADLVTGDIRRLTSVGLRPSPTFSPIYHPARRGTHVRRDLALLRDRIAPNKLYRRSFWVDNGLEFPVGVLYEDTPVTLRAHVLARSVDVLDTPVYVWRIRQGADRSITQRRLEERALVDRVAAVRTVSRFLAEAGGEAGGDTGLKAAYDRLALTDDLRLFARELDRADPAYVELFLEHAGAFLAAADPSALDDVPAIERVRWHLVGQRDAAGLVALARAQHVAPAGRRVVRRLGGRFELDLPEEVGSSRMPRRLLRMDAELELRTGVVGLAVDGQRLVVDGWASLDHGDVAVPADRKHSIWLEHLDDGTRIDLPTSDLACPAASAAAPDLYDRTGAGFRVEVDATALAARWERGTDRWRLMVEVAVGRTVRRGPLTGLVPGRTRRPTPVDVGRLRVGARFDQGPLDVVVAARPVLVTDLRVVDGRIVVGLRSRRSLRTLRLRAAGRDDVLVDVVTSPDGTGFEAVLDPVPLAGHVGTTAERTVELHALDERGRASRLSVDDAVDHCLVAVGRGVVGIEVSRYGYASLRCCPPVLVVDAATTSSVGLLLDARVLGGDPAALRVRLDPRDRTDPRAPDVEVLAPERVRIHVDPATLPRRAGTLVLSAALAGDVAAGPDGAGDAGGDGTGGHAELGLRTSRTLAATLPVEVPGAALPTTFDDRSWHQPVVEVGDGLTDTQRADALRRRHLDEAVRASSSRRGRRLDDAVLVVARGGRGTHDCPRAVADALRLRAPELAVRWAVHQAAVVPPEGTHGVPVDGPGWYEALASARLVVTDGPLPTAFERDPAQRVVRLWTGVPVRPVGRRGPGVPGAEQPADARRAWSHLVAAGPTAADVLADGFDLDAAPLACGLPRHDVLADTGTLDDRRRRVRLAVGASPDEPVVLHLPTWVDVARHPGGALRRLDDLDLAALSAALPGTRLLVRSHPAVVDSYADLDATPGITDVRGDVAVVDLLLAADVVLAHPSSVVLEAARVGVPVVVYDPAGFGLADQLGAPSVDVVATARPAGVAQDLDGAVDAVRDVLATTVTAATATVDPAAPSAVAARLVDVDPARHLEVVGASAAGDLAELLLG